MHYSSLTYCCMDYSFTCHPHIYQFVNFSYVFFTVKLYCCTDCMDSRPGVSAVRSLPVPQRLAHAAFTYCIISPLCLLLRLNDDDDDDDLHSGLERIFSSIRTQTRSFVLIVSYCLVSCPHWCLYCRVRD